MTSQKDLRRKKVIRVGQEFMDILFEHPDNYYVESGIPEGSNFVQMYHEVATDTTNIIYQNDCWEALEAGEEIPELNVQIYERFCSKCETEMMFDEQFDEQYCPRCERKFVW